MNEAKIRKLFHDCTLKMPIGHEKKDLTLHMLEEIMSEKELEPTISKWEMIKNQFRYMEKDILLIQAFFFLIIILGMTVLHKSSIDELSYFKFGTGAAVWIGIFVIFGIARQYFNHFAELGETCYFNVKQIVALRMLLFGILDALLLFVMMIIISQKTEKNLLETGIYLLVPFLVSGCFYVGILLTEGGRRNIGLLLGMSFFLIVIFTTISSIPMLYERAVLTVWYVVLVFVSLVLVAEVIMFFRKIGEGDILCTH